MAGEASDGALPLTRRQLVGGMTVGALAPAVLRAAKPGSAAHVVVVGAGVFGTWTSWHLQQAGHRVTLVDAFGPANSRASSGGETRMTRAGYGKDAIYSQMALASLPHWQALSERSGLPIFHPHGVLFFFADEFEYFRDSVRVHAEMGLPTEVLDVSEMIPRWPMFDFAGVKVAIFEPQFGALMARRSVQTLSREFVRAGGEWLKGKAAPITMPRGPMAMSSLRLTDGRNIGADQFVFACGPWLPQVFPDVLDRKIVTSRQEVFFFAPPDGDASFSPVQMPGWADFDGVGMHYGFPDLEARGAKICHDDHGEEVDPDTNPRQITEAGLAEIIAYRDMRFPKLRGAVMTESRVCQYENSSNGDFLIDRHPGYTNITFAGAGSGHGFKHGPEVGRLAAEVALGAPQTETRFTLATKENTQARSVI